VHTIITPEDWMVHPTITSSWHIHLPIRYLVQSRYRSANSLLKVDMQNLKEVKREVFDENKKLKSEKQKRVFKAQERTRKPKKYNFMNDFEDAFAFAMPEPKMETSPDT
jgi:hypothetical protein